MNEEEEKKLGKAKIGDLIKYNYWGRVLFGELVKILKVVDSNFASEKNIEIYIIRELNRDFLQEREIEKKNIVKVYRAI